MDVHSLSYINMQIHTIAYNIIISPQFFATTTTHSDNKKFNVTIHITQKSKIWRRRLSASRSAKHQEAKQKQKKTWRAKTKCLKSSSCCANEELLWSNQTQITKPHLLEFLSSFLLRSPCCHYFSFIHPWVEDKTTIKYVHRTRWREENPQTNYADLCYHCSLSLCMHAQPIPLLLHALLHKCRIYCFFCQDISGMRDTQQEYGRLFTSMYL